MSFPQSSQLNEEGGVEDGNSARGGGDAVTV